MVTTIYDAVVLDLIAWYEDNTELNSLRSSINAMSSPTADQPKKRTRVLTVRQSSRGCLTCKARRIKCDETKPECLRCQRGQRFCAGHAYQGFSPSEEEETRVAVARSTSSCPAPQPALTNAVTTSADGRDLSQLACRVFAADSNYLFGPAESLFFSRLLPQFSDSIPFVSASAAAFGAAYRAEVLKDGTAVTRSEVQYMKAIRLLRNELDGPLQRFIPFFISSILLAGAEVVSGRKRNAVVHLLSIFSIFFPNGGQSASGDEASGRLLPAVNEIMSAGGSPDDFDRVLRALDVQIAFSSWSRPPVLPSRLHTLTSDPTSVDELIKQQPIIIHACMHFIGSILQENQTRGHITLSPTRLSQQAALITCLTQWLHQRDQLLTTTNSHDHPLPLPQQHHISVLTAQCHTFLITTSTLLTATQLAYDTHHSSFTQIIHLSESVLGPCLLPTVSPTVPSSSSAPRTTAIPHHIPPHHTSAPDPPPFSPIAGLIPSLALTARKCRSPLRRRQAIALLLRTGKEGPLVGTSQAALGRRVCEIEEGSPFGFCVPAEALRRRNNNNNNRGKNREGERQGALEGEEETVEEYLARVVPEHRRVRASWRVSLALPQRLGGVVRYARVVDPGLVGEGAGGGGNGSGDKEGPSEQEEEMHLEVWAERMPEFEIVDSGVDGGKVWTTVREVEGWNEWLDPMAWRLLPFEII